MGQHACKLIILLLLLTGCGGKLTDEQRKKLHEGMATQDIKRVTDAELQEAAMTYGKKIMEEVVLADKSLKKKTRIDSLEKVFHVRIYSLIPADAQLREIENQLVEAYVAGGGPEQVSDNLQKMGDSLLYTRPVFKEGPGGVKFDHAIGIMISTRGLVLSMPKP